MPQAKKAPPAITDTRPESDSARVETELQQLATELEQAGGEQRQAIHVLVDRWLDERLNQRQAHKPTCRCDTCLAAHPLMRRRPLGECIDRRDIATPGEW